MPVDADIDRPFIETVKESIGGHVISSDVRRATDQEILDAMRLGLGNSMHRCRFRGLEHYPKLGAETK